MIFCRVIPARNLHKSAMLDGTGALGFSRSKDFCVCFLVVLHDPCRHVREQVHLARGQADVGGGVVGKPFVRAAVPLGQVCLDAGRELRDPSGGHGEVVPGHQNLDSSRNPKKGVGHRRVARGCHGPASPNRGLLQ